MAELIWKDRKRAIFGLPWTFTRYSLTTEKLFIETGLFTRNEEEIRLYRVLDMSLHCSFRERILGLGTIHLFTADHTSPEIDLKHIKKAREVKELISDMVEHNRSEKKITAREYLSGSEYIDDDDNANYPPPPPGARK